MKTTIETVKNLFKSNFSELKFGKLVDLNEATIKIMASFENTEEGGFYDPELILDAFNNKIDEEAVKTMLEAIKEGYVEVASKKEGDDYIITAGYEEAVYIIRLQIFRIK